MGKKTKLPGTVVAKQGRLYVVLSRTDHAGARRRDYHRVPGDTQAAATALQIKLAHDLNTGAYIAPTDVTLGEFLDRYLKGHASRWRGNTLRGYRQKVNNQIRPRIGNVRLQNLDRLTLREFFQALVDDGYAHRTIKQTHAVLSGALNSAVEDGWLMRTPLPPAPKASSVERAVDRRPVQRAWSAEHLNKFLASTQGDRLHPMWLLGSRTGLRREELSGLLWEHVKFDRRQIVVAWVRTPEEVGVMEDWPKTTGSRRVVDVDDETVDVLRAVRDQQEIESLIAGDLWLTSLGPECAHEGIHVFTNELGAPYHPNHLSKQFAKAVKASGVPHRRLYDLRHTHATLLLEAGIDPKIVAERLGHSSASFTRDAYMEVTTTMQRSAVDAFTRMVGE